MLKITDAALAEQIAAVPNMNSTGRLPAIAMVHLGMIIRLTNTVEAPEAVTDSTGEVVGIDLDPDEPTDATEHSSSADGIRILHKLPTVTVKLHNVTTEFLPPIPCTLHAADGPCRECGFCDFRAGCVAVEPQLARRSFIVEVQIPGTDTSFNMQVQRRQLPMTIRTASTIHTLQGATANPGLIFHWKFPRFFSAELRWLATYHPPHSDINPQPPHPPPFSFLREGAACVETQGPRPSSWNRLRVLPFYWFFNGPPGSKSSPREIYSFQFFSTPPHILAR